ncbi:MAG: hypothetical protein VXX63_02120 [Bacteroidota bacterium]|nr:hypothetical protein [Bacteroidota bacterium]
MLKTLEMKLFGKGTIIMQSIWQKEKWCPYCSILPVQIGAPHALEWKKNFGKVKMSSNSVKTLYL